MTAYSCCRHCDLGGDWHAGHGRDTHRDECPEGCGGVPTVHLDRHGDGLSPRCGNRGWARVTSDLALVSCRTCLNIEAGAHAVDVRDVEPCGTEAAYRREMRRERQGGPPAHRECRRAASREAYDRRARRRRRQEVLAA